MEQVEFGAIERESRKRTGNFDKDDRRERDRERKKELKQQKEIDATTQCTRMYLGLSSFSYSSFFWAVVCVSASEEKPLQLMRKMTEKTIT